MGLKPTPHRVFAPHARKPSARLIPRRKPSFRPDQRPQRPARPQTHLPDHRALHPLPRPRLGVPRDPLNPLLHVLSIHVFDATTFRQCDAQREHAGALDRKVNDRRDAQLIGRHTNVVSHDRLDLRAHGFDSRAQVVLRFQVSKHARQAVSLEAACLGKLPGVGPRSAERIALHLVQTESATNVGPDTATGVVLTDATECARAIELGK